MGMAPIWTDYPQRTDEPDLNGLRGIDRFLTVIKRKPADWVPGGWYDPDAGQSRSCQLAQHGDLCSRICSCSCHAQRLAEVLAMPKPEKRCSVCGRASHPYTEGEASQDIDLPLGWAISSKAAALAYS